MHPGTTPIEARRQLLGVGPRPVAGLVPVVASPRAAAVAVDAGQPLTLAEAAVVAGGEAGARQPKRCCWLRPRCQPLCRTPSSWRSCFRRRSLSRPFRPYLSAAM